jgi:DNA-directed RNA polymerase omega subunit
MMLHLLDDLPEDIDSKYRLVIIAAKRSKALGACHWCPARP